MISDYIGRQFGNYRIVRKLASGSFGTVYLAEHLHLELLAAIKILHVSMELDIQARDKFLHEAQVNARLQHPHIIRLIDFGFDESMPYMVMDYVPNGTLRMLHPRGTRLSEEQIVRYVKQIAPALNYAHEQKVIHRDIKPENILLNGQQELVLSDFGIAVVQSTLDSLSPQSPAGTPLYMAPEQINGQPCAASDQYALGVMVYEWLSGEPPFQGPTMTVFMQHLHKSPPSLCARLPHLTPAVEDAVLGTLAKNPLDRFSSVQEFAVALEKAFYATQPLLLEEPVKHAIQPEPPMASVRLVPVSTSNKPDPVDHSTEPQPRAIRRLEEQPAPVSIISHQAPAPALQNQNRLHLLKRVRSFWITGVLEHSLHGAALIALGLQEQPDAVLNPWRLIMQHPQAASQPLPVGTRILQVYDASNGELLILGAPGSGKTTLLLELARDLLVRAEQDEQYPLPMVFSLSSWRTKYPSLIDWLVDELTSKYQVPHKLAQRLVAMDQLLPLLDGLDEVNAKDRTACIEAINAYRQEHGLLPLVVCSRSADYLQQTARVKLGNAVAIQPLSEQQVNDYIVRAGTALQALQVALRNDPVLRELTQTPLMLNMLTLTYYNMPVQDVLRMTSTSNQVQQVVERYVERMLTRQGSVARYSSSSVKLWLSWLAKQLQKRGQPLYYIERVQPDWLVEERASQHHARIVMGIIFGLLGLFALGPVSGVIIPTDIILKENALLFSGYVLSWILLFGFLNGILYPVDRLHPGISNRRRRWRRGWQSIIRSIQNGLLAGLLIGCAYGFVQNIQTPDAMLISMLALGVRVGVLGGVMSGLIDGLLNVQPETIQPAETISWSWASMGRNLVKFLVLGVLCLLLYGLLLGLIATVADGSSLVDNVQLGLWASASLVPYFASLGLLVGGLTGGVSTTLLKERDITQPNLGIRHSARHSVLVGIISVLVVVETAILLRPLLGDITLWLALFVGPLVGLVSALRAGGIACIQHMVLRWLLWKNKMMPWHQVRFLNYATEHVLLSKVGGGYMFVHRFLLEYFVAIRASDV